MNKSTTVPFDCGVTIEEQLEKVYLEKIDILFITNHNTLNGYKQMIEYQRNHEKYKNIMIFPGEEVTVNNGGHVLSYGIYDGIKPGMTVEETIDEIKRQNAISCAAHPFAVSNGIRDSAKMCDIMESFNSNNIDNFSNIVAEKFAKENNMLSIAGSDSHVKSTIGRCLNTLEADKTIDSVIDSMRHGKFDIIRKNYANKEELYEQAHYILSQSRNSVLETILKTNPKVYPLFKWLLDKFISKPDMRLWRLMGSIGFYLSKRMSKKVNIKGHDPNVFQNRSWKNLILLSLIP
ncbi:MAG: PHP-associated domain-containing protein [Nitrososphaeraceae archaeon]